MKFKLPFGRSRGSFTINSPESTSHEYNAPRPSFRPFTETAGPSESTRPKNPAPKPPKSPPPAIPETVTEEHLNGHSNVPESVLSKPIEQKIGNGDGRNEEKETVVEKVEEKEDTMGCVTSKDKEEDVGKNTPQETENDRKINNKVEKGHQKDQDFNLDEDIHFKKVVASKTNEEEQENERTHHHMQTKPNFNIEEITNLNELISNDENEGEIKIQITSESEKVQNTEVLKTTVEEQANVPEIKIDEFVEETKEETKVEENNEKQEEVDEISPLKEVSITVNTKKTAVSAESSAGKVKSSTEIKLDSFEKDLANQELIKRGLKENNFLNFGLDTDSLIQTVVNAMYLMTQPADSYIIREGDPGHQLYVIAKGTVEVYKGSTLVNTLGPGKVFGELAVLYYSKRNASILAKTDCSLWVLDRKVFNKIMMKAGLQRQEENIKFLRSVPLLKNLDKQSLIKMSDLLKQFYFEPGKDIVCEGEEGNTFYIITKGKVRVTTAEPDGTTKEIAILDAGSFFGEGALLYNMKRKATVTAIADTECLALEREPFNEHLGSIQYLKETAQNRVNTTPRDSEVTPVSEYDHVKLTDLNIIGTLGVGGFGRVELVKDKNTGSIFALKKVKKCVILEQQQEEHILNEKKIMLACRSHFIGRLYKTYHDKKYLFLLMEACMGGDVWTLLQRHGRFHELDAKFLVGCVVLGLEYLHVRGIVYRDLKPENMMLDANGFVKLIDFGFAKEVGTATKTWTFAGTPEYMAPEVVRNKGHDRAADYWSLGIFVHELLAGKPPFRGRNHDDTYNLILRGLSNIHFPQTISRIAGVFIRRLCKDRPTDRLGYQKDGVKDIKNHSWFQDFSWDSLVAGSITPPIIPRLMALDDLSNFDKYPRDIDIPPDSLWDIDF